MRPGGTYENGKQDAWIESIRANCTQNVTRIMRRLNQQSVILNNLTAKVNHIYGGAVILGAVAGVVGSIGVQIIVAFILHKAGA